MPNVPRPILWVGHNIDWLTALVIVVVYFLHDQGIVAIGEGGSPEALVHVSGQTIAAAAGLLMVLRGLVERKVRK